jgi:hypothetical protein
MEHHRGLDKSLLKDLVSRSYVASRLAPVSAASSPMRHSSNSSNQLQRPGVKKKSSSLNQLSSASRGHLARVLSQLNSDVSAVDSIHSSVCSDQAVVTCTNKPSLSAVAQIQCQGGPLSSGRIFIPSAKESKDGRGAAKGDSGKVDKGPYGFFIDFAMGGISAAVSKTAAAPIERVKLLIQNQDEMMKAGRLTTPYKGVLECFQRTIKDEGMYSLWRGNLANVLRYSPTQVFPFQQSVSHLSDQ